MLKSFHIYLKIVYFKSKLGFCIFVLSVLCFSLSTHAIKEKDDAVDACELDLNNPCSSGYMGSDFGEKDNDFRDQHSPEERGEAGDDAPWEKRYEKLWVEVEKREVKSTYRNVAGELKEKFGELLRSRCPAKEVQEKEQAEYASAEEESSDEEEGEVIVRPTARARSIVLLTIPEQRESGLEDSVTESTDKSVCEDRMQVCEHPVSESSMCREPDLLTDEECRSPSPQVTTAQRDGNIDHVTTAFTNDRTVPVSDVDTFLNNKAELGPFQKPHLDHTLKNNTANPDEAEKNHASSEEVPEEFTKCRPPSLSRCSTSVPGVSDEKLEEDMERFKLEVGMLKVVFLDLEKEKAELQKEVEDGRPSHSRLDRLSFSPFHPCTSFLLISCFRGPKLATTLFFVGCSFSMS